jgi:hypothetical protein
MAPKIVLQPIRIAGDDADDHARLMFVDGRLAAVLTLLQEEIHSAEHRGRWFVEAAFGAIADRAGELVFTTLEEALSWFQEQWRGS